MISRTEWWWSISQGANSLQNLTDEHFQSVFYESVQLLTIK